MFVCVYSGCKGHFNLIACINYDSVEEMCSIDLTGSLVFQGPLKGLCHEIFIAGFFHQSIPFEPLYPFFNWVVTTILFCFTYCPVVQNTALFTYWQKKPVIKNRAQLWLLCLKSTVLYIHSYVYNLYCTILKLFSNQHFFTLVTYFFTIQIHVI